jgi:hypothetical protein
MTGFNSKRRMAADKFQKDLINYGTSWSQDGKRIDPMSVYKEPAQEPANYLHAVLSAFGPDAGISLDQKGWSQLHTAIKAVLAQPVQEPAFKWRSVFQEMPIENSHILFCFGVHIVEGSFTTNGWASLAYGTAQPDFWAYFPPPPHHKRNQELYTTPPQRPWVGLTDEEIHGTAGYNGTRETYQFALALIAKLKEKSS